jgi:hypothetical protein
LIWNMKAFDGGQFEILDDIVRFFVEVLSNTTR